MRGRSQILKLNYRTSHQIRVKADRLLGPDVADVDGNAEDRRGAISAFNGPDPTVCLFETQDEEADAVSICTMHLAKGLEFRAVEPASEFLDDMHVQPAGAAA